METLVCPYPFVIFFFNTLLGLVLYCLLTLSSIILLCFLCCKDLGRWIIYCTETVMEHVLGKVLTRYHNNNGRRIYIVLNYIAPKAVYTTIQSALLIQMVAVAAVQFCDNFFIEGVSRLQHKRVDLLLQYRSMVWTIYKLLQQQQQLLRNHLLQVCVKARQCHWICTRCGNNHCSDSLPHHYNPVKSFRWKIYKKRKTKTSSKMLHYIYTNLCSVIDIFSYRLILRVKICIVFFSYKKD